MAPKLYFSPKRPLCHLFLFIILIPSCPSLQNTQQLPTSKLTVYRRPESPSHSHPLTGKPNRPRVLLQCFGWIREFDCGQVCTSSQVWSRPKPLRHDYYSKLKVVRSLRWINWASKELPNTCPVTLQQTALPRKDLFLKIKRPGTFYSLLSHILFTW